MLDATVTLSQQQLKEIVADYLKTRGMSTIPNDVTFIHTAGSSGGPGVPFHPPFITAKVQVKL
jgi:hypothetical protein